LLHLLTSGPGTKRPIRDVRCSVAIEGKADLGGHRENDANDPSATSGLISFCGDCGND